MNNQLYMKNYGVIFRIYPNDEQQWKIAVNSGCSRKVWNELLSLYNKQYQKLSKQLDIANTFLGTNDKYSIVIKETDLEWPKLGKYSDLIDEFDFLKNKEVDSKNLDNSRRNLNQAFSQAFKDIKKSNSQIKKSLPKFKRKDKYTLKYTTEVQGKKQYNLFNKKGYVSLPKLGNVKVNKHCNIIGKVGTIKVFMDNMNRYFISCTVINDNVINVKETVDFDDTILGLDVGLDNAIITSDGDKIKHKVSKKNINNIEKRRRHYQKMMSRRKNYSNRYNKARIKKNKQEKKIANKVKDSNHKIINEVLKLSDYFHIEDLKTKKMSEQKKTKLSNMSKSIRQRGLSQMLQILEYKADNQGKTVKRVSSFFASTQLCSNCGYKNTDLAGNCSIREWSCPECNTIHDRDINAAKNIRDYKFK